MRRWQTTVLDRLTPTSASAPLVSADGDHRVAAAASTARRPWRQSRAWRWGRDISVAVLAACAVPVLLIAWGGGAERPTPKFELLTTTARQEYLANRAVALEKDPSITPQLAAAALHRVLPTERRERIPELVRDERKHVGAYLAPPDSALFPRVQRRGTDLEVRSLIRAATGPLSAAERAWLASTAALPIWADVDLAARAERVDIHGMSSAGADAGSRATNDLPHFERMVARRLAHAGVARAAWHLSRGERDVADSVLRSLVSLAGTLLEERLHFHDVRSLRFIANAGREALAELRGGPEAPAVSATSSWFPASMIVRAANPAAASESVMRSHADYVAMLQNPEIPRAVRLQHVDIEPFVECGSVRSVYLGPAGGGRAKSAEALRGLARSDAEWQQLLAERDVILQGSISGYSSLQNPFKYFGVAFARLTTILTGNTHVEGCTLVALLDPAK